MGNTAVKGYTEPLGGRTRIWIGDVTGPASYAVWTKPNTGGQVVNAKNLGGLNAVNFIAAAGLSLSGTYYIEAKLAVGSGGSPSTAILVWFLTASPGTQPSANTNLSGESVRLMALGG